MKLNINEYNNKAYIFANAYLQRFRGQPYHSTQSNVSFDFELMNGQYDNVEFDIDPDVFNWQHIMVAERYVEKNKTKFQRDSIMQSFYGEMGPNNPFKMKRMGGKTRRRIRRRAHRRRPSLKKGTKLP